MFGRRDTKDPTKLLKLHSNDWRQGELLRVTPRRRWDTDPTVTRMVIRRHDQLISSHLREFQSGL